MTTATETTQEITPELISRNIEVNKAYDRIIKATGDLLRPFANQKYRTTITIDHTKSGRETNLLKEFLTSFFTVTLTVNRANYNMIYLSYDDSAIQRFGARLYNRVLREMFRHTMQEKGKPNITDCIRINNPKPTEAFFTNRLVNGETAHIKISIVEKD